MLSTIKVLLILAFLVGSIESRPSLKCLTYMLQLKALYDTNKALFLKQIAPYMIYSGKQFDDMGFPKLCNQNGMEYTTVKLETYITDQHISEHPDFLFSFYYGFCFTNICSVSDLNEGGEFIIQKIFQDTPVLIQSVAFYDAQLQSEISASSIIIIVLILLWMLITMVGPFSKWVGQCQQRQISQVQISIPLQQPDKKIVEQQEEKYQQPIQIEFFKSISLGRKWMSLWKSEQSTKIKQFSHFKIISVPIIIYGYYFYLCNKASFNIFSFNSQIYEAFYSKVATFAYFIPDIFFFISGYLFTKNVFTQVQFAGSKVMLLLQNFLRKLLRLYPIYIVCLVIFWAVVPSLHSGPVWMIYKEQIDKCQTVWWRNILMIDNFFSSGCFNFSWWVQAQIQYTILTVFTFAILFINKSLGSIILYIELLASWILLFVLSQKLPAELEITFSNSTQHYFKSFHSHLPFYLTGVMLALIFKKESSRRLVINYYFKNTIVLILGLASAMTIYFLVLVRPSIFSYDSLNIQLALCRTGAIYAFIIYCLPGFVKQRNNKTIVHKLAKLTYPIILISGVIVGASYWGLQSFPYVSGPNMLYYLFPNLFLSLSVGLVLHLLFNFSSSKTKQPHAI